MSEHTPGPWTYEVHELGSAIAKDGYCLATAHGTIAIKGGQWPHEANARLIARAPEMAAEIERLTARVAELEGALTPSAETKAAYIGEFHFTEYYMDEDGNDAWRKITVPWDTVKEIMAAIRARAAITFPSKSRG